MLRFHYKFMAFKGKKKPKPKPKSPNKNKPTQISLPLKFLEIICYIPFPKEKELFIH